MIINQQQAKLNFKGNQFRIIKGAAQTVASLCKATDEKTLKAMDVAIDRFSQNGSGMIAVAISENDKIGELRVLWSRII